MVRISLSQMGYFDNLLNNVGDFSSFAYNKEPKSSM